MKKTVVYIHGKGGSADEAFRFVPLFREHKVAGLTYRAQTPWDAKAEFPALIERVCPGGAPFLLIANSLGAYLALHALADLPVEKAFFISPVVDMEQLIRSLMAGAGVDEDELRARRELTTPHGETLSWDYLSYVRAHPVVWHAPTEILYGENDALVPYESAAAFAARTGAGLTVMPGGEHWFHTAEQLAFLENWIKKAL